MGYMREGITANTTGTSTVRWVLSAEVYGHSRDTG